MMHACLMILVVTGSLFLPFLACAAEVTNLGLVYNNSAITMEYDLAGKKGEKSSAVAVSVEFNGKEYSAGMLSLEGDFGEKVTVGSHKKIVWRYLEDVPKEIDGSFKCHVDAVSPLKLPPEWESPMDGIREGRFAVSRQTVTDIKTKLMWLRNAGYSARPLHLEDALKLVADLNTRRYGGYSDWRVPTVSELEQLAGAGRETGSGKSIARYVYDYLATIGFLNVRSGSYWTSTISSAPDNKVYVVSTWNGSTHALSGMNYYYLLPVRNI